MPLMKSSQPAVLLTSERRSWTGTVVTSKLYARMMLLIASSVCGRSFWLTLSRSRLRSQFGRLGAMFSKFWTERRRHGEQTGQKPA